MTAIAQDNRFSDRDFTTALPDGAGDIIRPGEHACCRFDSAGDRKRVVASVVGRVLQRGDRVVYLHDRVDAHELVSDLADADEAVGTALDRGQLVVRAPRIHAVEGTFDIDFLLGWCSDERDRSLADGYEGLMLIVEVGASIGDGQALEDFERRLDALASPATAILCIYDPARAAPSSAVASLHDVDLAPELAPVGRRGHLEAAHLRSGALRLAGELDFDDAPLLSEVLRACGRRSLALDLADLHFVDVAGMRGLRGRRGERSIAIVAASEAVRRLSGLMGWDRDPGVAWCPGGGQDTVVPIPSSPLGRVACEGPATARLSSFAEAIR
jgi:anti-anti-sigma regulatory factor